MCVCRCWIGERGENRMARTISAIWGRRPSSVKVDKTLTATLLRLLRQTLNHFLVEISNMIDRSFFSRMKKNNQIRYISKVHWPLLLMDFSVCPVRLEFCLFLGITNGKQVFIFLRIYLHWLNERKKVFNKFQWIQQHNNNDDNEQWYEFTVLCLSRSSVWSSLWCSFMRSLYLSCKVWSSFLIFCIFFSGLQRLLQTQY